MTQPEGLDLRDPPTAALLGWLVPGLGHLYQGRIGKGVLFLVCVYGLFFTGCILGSWQVVYFRWDQREWRWPYLAQVGVGLAALPAMVPDGALRGALPESIRRLELPPDETEEDERHFTSGWKMELATVYTMIAGLLNLLAVYDAFAGPALYEEERRERAAKARPPGGAARGEEGA